jgi:hypothetical protein
MNCVGSTHGKWLAYGSSDYLEADLLEKRLDLLPQPGTTPFSSEETSFQKILGQVTNTSLDFRRRHI